METTSKTYLDTIKAAELLSISRRTLERWRLEGNGPVYLKLGSRVVYFLPDLNTWLNQQRRHSTANMQ